MIDSTCCFWLRCLQLAYCLVWLSLLGLAEPASAVQTSTMAYGAFCDIKCSTDGLIHISQLGVRGSAPACVACTSL